jgi:uncharacterized protein YjiS (DUF1127 family)
MYTANEHYGPTVQEGVVPDSTPAGGSPAITVRIRTAAGNDAIYDEPAMAFTAAAPAAQSARAATQSGADALAESASLMWPDISRMYQAARSARARAMGALMIAAIHAAGALAHREYERLGRYRRARSVRTALADLDDHTLRDIGLDRSEISSVAAEMAGMAARTRMRTLLS